MKVKACFVVVALFLRFGQAAAEELRLPIPDMFAEDVTVVDTGSASPSALAAPVVPAELVVTPPSSRKTPSATGKKKPSSSSRRDSKAKSGKSTQTETTQPKPSPLSATAERAPQTATHDILPATFAAMGKYDKIAMQPYADTYDSMPLKEKALTYARQFERMHGRNPNFPPEVAVVMNGSSRNIYEAKQYMYKQSSPSSIGNDDIRFETLRRRKTHVNGSDARR